MPEDLKDDFYRMIYILTFVLVFCIIPLVFFVANTDLNRQEVRYECDNPLEIIELLSQGQPGAENQFVYKLSDGTSYTTTIKYALADKVCKF